MLSEKFSCCIALILVTPSVILLNAIMQSVILMNVVVAIERGEKGDRAIMKKETINIRKK